MDASLSVSTITSGSAYGLIHGAASASETMAAPVITAGGVFWSVFFIFFLVFFNGFFVAAEFSLVRVRNTQLDPLAKAGSARAKLGLKLLSHLDAYLSATQLGITITSILLGWIGEPSVSKYLVEPVFYYFGLLPDYKTAMHITSIVLGTSIITLLHVVLGELSPKSIAIQKPEATTLFCAHPLYFFYRVMYPFIASLNNIANFLLRQIGIHPASESDMAHTEEELRLLVASSRRHGVITGDAQDLLENVFDLKETFIREITLPRNRVLYFDIHKPLAFNLAMAKRTAHSRYPLVDGDLDRTIGQVHIKDIFWKMNEAGQSPTDEQFVENPVLAGGLMAGEQTPQSGADFLRKIARRIPIVPETMTLDQALRQFQSEHIHLAMVVDEFGVVTGMVTFENIIETIVGEVRDEFDHNDVTGSHQFHQIADGYVMPGDTKISEIDEKLGTELEDEEVDTIAGLFLREAGHLPHLGERVTVDGVELTALKVEGLRIMSMRIRRVEQPQEQ